MGATEAIYLITCAFAVALILAAILDIRYRRVPNWLVLATLALAIARWCIPFDFGAMAIAFGLGFATLLVGFGLFSMKWIGGGDAKLIAAVVVWFGLEQFGAFLLLMCVAGAVLAMVQIVARRFSDSGATKSGSLPYAVAIALGGVMLVPLQLF